MDNAVTHPDLANFILAEVQRQTSEDALRKLVETKIGDCVKNAVDGAMRSYGDVGKQIEKAVANSLSIGDRIDVPAYGTMVMALLRAKLDETVSQLVNDKLANEMSEILKLAPKEVRFSDLVNKMIEDIDKHDRWGTYATVEIQESEYSEGTYYVHMDPQEKVRPHECETQFHVDKDGKIYALQVNRKDVKTVVSMGPYWGYQKMLFSAYACGSKLVMDDLDPATGIGDF